MTTDVKVYTVEEMHWNLHKDAKDMKMGYTELTAALQAHGDFSAEEYNALIAIHKRECEDEVVVVAKDAPTTRYKRLDTDQWQWEIENSNVKMQGTADTLEEAKEKTKEVADRWEANKK